MKLVLLLAAATVLGIIAATVVVGSKVREETVVARPYEEGLSRTVGCDVGARPCIAALDGAGEVSLELAPRPLRTMQELSVRAEARGVPAGSRVRVAFTMDDMWMGENAVALAETAPGRWEGRAVLVRCPSGRKGWTAEVTVAPPGAPPRIARFHLAVTE